MEGTHDISVFLLASLVLWVTPGPDMMFILAQCLSQGTRAGIISVFGLSTGAILHTMFAAFGLSAFLAASAFAFTVLKYAGAVYLIYLGVQALRSDRSKPGPIDISSVPATSGWHAYSRGVVANLLNPKVAIFFMAFLPQFINPEMDRGAVPFLFLGGLFVLGGTLWTLTVAYCATRATHVIRRNPHALGWLERGAGGIYLGLGIRLLQEES